MFENIANISFIPCQVHRLNTYLEHGCQASHIIKNFIVILEDIYIFFTASIKRSSKLEKCMAEIE